MYGHVLRRFQRAAQAGHIRFTDHALDALEDDGWTTDDALNCVLTGTIIKDQYDARHQQTKYVLFGDALNGAEMGLIVRWAEHIGVLVITTYQLRIDDYE